MVKPRTFRLEKAMRTTDSFKDSIRAWYKQCLAGHWTWAKILEHRSEWLLSAEAYQRLPERFKYELSGYWDAFFDPRWGRLWTEDTDGRWELDGKLYQRGPEREAAFTGRWPEVIYKGVFYKDSSDPLSLSEGPQPTTH